MSKQRVKKFGVVQTSLVAAVIVFFTSLVFIIPVGLIMGVTGMGDMPGVAVGGLALVVAAPIFYGVGAFIVTAISCLLYNWIAKWTGGIELEIEIVDSPSE